MRGRAGPGGPGSGRVCVDGCGGRATLEERETPQRLGGLGGLRGRAGLEGVTLGCGGGYPSGLEGRGAPRRQNPERVRLRPRVRAGWRPPASRILQGSFQDRLAGLSGPSRLSESERGHLSPGSGEGPPGRPHGSVLQRTQKPLLLSGCGVGAWIRGAVGLLGGLTPRPCGLGPGAVRAGSSVWDMAAAWSWHCHLPSLCGLGCPPRLGCFLSREMQKYYISAISQDWGELERCSELRPSPSKGTQCWQFCSSARERCPQEGRLPVADSQWPGGRILRNPATSSGLAGKQAARTERRPVILERSLMPLPEGQAGGEEPWVWAGCPLSCPALLPELTMGPPLPSTRTSPFSAQLWGHLTRRCQGR